ncbi:MAG: hypothetical protein ACSHWS_00675 [Sulfitobacter sp.]
MSCLIRWALCGLAAFCALCAFGESSAQAQTFEVKLGDKSLGTLAYSRDSKGENLRSALNNTPLGVFNGTFAASSQQVQSSSGASAHKYRSISKSSRKTRQIGLVVEAGRAVEVVIEPSSQRTALSDVKNVPQGVIDPVGGIGHLIGARGCPKAFTIYDGRRAIRLQPNGAKRDADLLTCAIQYKVIAGPGHLSPLYISSVKMQVQYDLSGSQQRLSRMQLGSGLFNLVLNRTD